MSKIRQQEFQHLFSISITVVFSGYMSLLKMWKFIKGEKKPTVQKLNVDKPLTTSQAEYEEKNEEQI